MAGVCYNSTEDRPPIEQLAIDYDIPQELANKLIGRSEPETMHNIRNMVAYIASVVAARDDYFRTHGWPLTGRV